MVLLLSVGQNTRQGERAGSEVPQRSVSRTEVGNQRDAHRHCDVSSGPQRSSERQPERFVWDVLNAVVGAPRKPTPGAQRDGDEVPAARYPIAASGGEEPLPVRPTQSPHPSRCGNREIRNESRLRMRRDLDGWPSEVSHNSVQRGNHDRDAT